MNIRSPIEHLSSLSSRDFSQVQTWIFDLDNTLYPHTAMVWPQVDDRITLYIANHYGIDGASARELQKFFYYKYGTTLRALIDEDNVDPNEFLDFVHDIDHTHIELNPRLGDAIAALPGRKLILTNGSRKHAENVARKIGILDRFEDIFDIAAANFVPKPDRRAYEGFLQKYAIDPTRAAIFEDIAKNLKVPHELGMTTTLVVPQTLDPYREDFEQAAVETPDIDYITNDLAGFLQSSPNGYPLPQRPQE